MTGAIAVGVIGAAVGIASLIYSANNASEMSDKQDEMVNDSRLSAANDMALQKEMSKLTMEEMAVQVGKKLLENKRLKRQACKLSHDLQGASASQISNVNTEISTTGGNKPGALV
jgi:peroxiredoxin family protein